MLGRLLNDEAEKVQSQSVMALFEALSRQLTGMTERNNVKHPINIPSVLLMPQLKFEMGTF
jgi:hypothetical protein